MEILRKVVKGLLLSFGLVLLFGFFGFVITSSWHLFLLPTWETVDYMLALLVSAVGVSLINTLLNK